MAFEPGHKKLGGKKKGSLNKKTMLLVPFIDQLEALNFDPVKKMVELYEELDSIGKSILLGKMIEYIFPKKKTIEITVEQALEILIHDLKSKGIDITASATSLPGPKPTIETD